uniref:Uncharacterized protein n=1 Tax=Lepeophtheirus salmonis TaxID=72036 RepID=A0A0K2USP8_LEPSM
MKLLVIFACLVVLASSANLGTIDFTLAVLQNGPDSCNDGCNKFEEVCVFGVCTPQSEMTPCNEAEAQECIGKVCAKGKDGRISCFSFA